MSDFSNNEDFEKVDPPSFDAEQDEVVTSTSMTGGEMAEEDLYQGTSGQNEVDLLGDFGGGGFGGSVDGKSSGNAPSEPLMSFDSPPVSEPTFGDSSPTPEPVTSYSSEPIETPTEGLLGVPGVQVMCGYLKNVDPRACEIIEKNEIETVQDTVDKSDSDSIISSSDNSYSSSAEDTDSENSDTESQSDKEMESVNHQEKSVEMDKDKDSEETHKLVVPEVMEDDDESPIKTNLDYEREENAGTVNENTCESNIVNEPGENGDNIGDVGENIVDICDSEVSENQENENMELSEDLEIVKNNDIEGENEESTTTEINNDVEADMQVLGMESKTKLAGLSELQMSEVFAKLTGEESDPVDNISPIVSDNEQNTDSDQSNGSSVSKGSGSESDDDNSSVDSDISGDEMAVGVWNLEQLPGDKLDSVEEGDEDESSEDDDEDNAYEFEGLNEHDSVEPREKHEDDDGIVLVGYKKDSEDEIESSTDKVEITNVETLESCQMDASGTDINMANDIQETNDIIESNEPDSKTVDLKGYKYDSDDEENELKHLRQDVQGLMQEFESFVSEDKDSQDASDEKNEAINDILGEIETIERDDGQRKDSNEVTLIEPMTITTATRESLIPIEHDEYEHKKKASGKHDHSNFHVSFQSPTNTLFYDPDSPIVEKVSVEVTDDLIDSDDEAKDIEQEKDEAKKELEAEVVKDLKEILDNLETECEVSGSVDFEGISSIDRLRAMMDTKKAKENEMTSEVTATDQESTFESEVLLREKNVGNDTDLDDDSIERARADSMIVYDNPVIEQELDVSSIVNAQKDTEIEVDDESVEMRTTSSESSINRESFLNRDDIASMIINEVDNASLKMVVDKNAAENEQQIMDLAILEGKMDINTKEPASEQIIEHTENETDLKEVSLQSTGNENVADMNKQNSVDSLNELALKWEDMNKQEEIADDHGAVLVEIQNSEFEPESEMEMPIEVASSLNSTIDSVDDTFDSSLNETVIEVISKPEIENANLTELSNDSENFMIEEETKNEETMEETCQANEINIVVKEKANEINEDIINPYQDEKVESLQVKEMLNEMESNVKAAELLQERSDERNDAKEFDLEMESSHVKDAFRDEDSTIEQISEPVNKELTENKPFTEVPNEMDVNITEEIINPVSNRKVENEQIKEVFNDTEKTLLNELKAVEEEIASSAMEPESSVVEQDDTKVSRDNVRMILHRAATKVLELIYWRDVKKTGVVFGSMMFVLLSLSCFSLLSVLAYLSLAILTVTFSFRVYKNVMQAVQKTNEGHPFKKLLEMDIELREEVVQNAAEKIACNINSCSSELRRMYLVGDYIDSLKFGLLLWLLTYVGAWFNGMTLVVLGVVSIFTLPKVYETYQGPIDQNVNMIRAQLNNIMAQVSAKIPFPKKKVKAQ